MEPSHRGRRFPSGNLERYHAGAVSAVPLAHDPAPTVRKTGRKPVGQRENTRLDGLDPDLQYQLEGLFKHHQSGEVEHSRLEASGFVRKLEAVVEHPVDVLPLHDASPAELSWSNGGERALG